jgi:hypothetical protein
VIRSLAGAASRFGQVFIYVPGPTPRTRPDGGFDVQEIGQDGERRWPNPSDVSWPTDKPDECHLILDVMDEHAQALLASFAGQSVHSLCPTSSPGSSYPMLELVPDTKSDFVGTLVPVNPLALGHRHNGFGFTDYVLVLSDRAEIPPPVPPTPLVGWLTAAFPSAHVVVVEGATASAWKGRALRGTVGIDSRMDLWRLIAHARVMVDLAPGAFIGRECIEAMRLGTPIVVPEASRSAAHARFGGGMTFSDVSDLLASIDRLNDPVARSAFAMQAKAYSDSHYGDSARTIDDLARVLAVA